MITQQQLTLEQLQQQQQLLQQHQQLGIGPDGRPLQQPTHAERAQQMLQQVQSQMSTLWASKDKKRPVYSEQFIQEIRRRLDAYFGLVLHNVRDTVPKKIGFFLVRQLQDKLQFELYNKLNDEQLFSSLLGEPSHIVEERRALTSQLNTLKKAAAVLQRDPQIAALNFDTIDAMFDSDLRELQRAAPKQQQQQQLGVSLTSGGPQQRLPAQQQQQARQQQQQQQQLMRQQPGTSRLSNGPPPPPAQVQAGAGLPPSSSLMLSSQQPPAPAALAQDGRGAPNARHLFERPVMFQTASNPLFND
ncbi:dynamin-like protein, putative [Eimeria necatrix]|uniref:Dynamin-like protein, putative n=1 Tax=Eimeria necatrix TaxID=51315 RepID=U6MKU4_9EIME|nr:dynamin-like protein, putative [Eimeria necatrix]CDJ63693.1 dynamin-like protein, putative [Eimeria necatrix]